jgi:hypothetical protein
VLVDRGEKEHVPGFDEPPVRLAEPIVGLDLGEAISEAAGVESVLQAATGVGILEGHVLSSHGAAVARPNREMSIVSIVGALLMNPALRFFA